MGYPYFTYLFFHFETCPMPILVLVQISPSYESIQDVFVNQLKILVKKKQLVELTLEEGWFSEEEMKVDLKWSQH